VNDLIAYAFLAGTILLTVYGQLIIKWQVSDAGALPGDLPDRIWYFLRVLANPWVLSCIGAAFAAFLCWIVAITRLPLSSAYPSMSITYPLVLCLSAVLFGESLTTLKIVGVGCIMAGVVIVHHG
jgi:multidrug transporter EmrE-like cation transporter